MNTISITKHTQVNLHNALYKHTSFNAESLVITL